MDEKIKSLLRLNFEWPAKGERLSLDRALRLAVQIAQLGAPHVSPNPTVGCVALGPNDEFLAAGFHPRIGERHAEIDVLQQLSPAEIKDSHFVVTLEPCAHEGRTPSCAKTLAKLPLRSLTYGLIDPFDKVAGKGLQILREAGVDVLSFVERAERLGYHLTPRRVAEWQADLERSCEIFLANVREHRPFVALKAALSLDGALALATGESQWLTGPAARERGHFLRASHDVTAIGVGTLLQDDPQLNVRLPGVQKYNSVLIFDPLAKGLNSDRDFKVYSTHAPERIFWATRTSALSKAAAQSRRARHIALPESNDSNEMWSALLQQLWQWDCKSVFVEGGAKTLGGLMSLHQQALKRGLRGWIDRVHLFQAPIFLGSQGFSVSQGFEVGQMNERLRLNHLRREQLGEDTYLTGKLGLQPSS